MLEFESRQLSGLIKSPQSSVVDLVHSKKKNTRVPSLMIIEVQTRWLVPAKTRTKKWSEMNEEREVNGRTAEGTAESSASNSNQSMIVSIDYWPICQSHAHRSSRLLRSSVLTVNLESRMCEPHIVFLR